MPSAATIDSNKPVFFGRWLGLALAMAIALLVAWLLVWLRKRADESRRAETLLVEIMGKSSRLNALQWQAIGQSEILPPIRREVREICSSLTSALNEVSQLASEEREVGEVRACFDRYIVAVQKELSLIEQGKKDEIRELDEEKVGPAYEALHQAIERSRIHFDEAVKASARRANAGSVLVLALVAAGLWFVFQMNLKMRRAHEERLQRRKKEYQGLVENIPDVVARLDRELRIVYVNAALEGTFGVNRSNLFGKSSAEAGMPVSMLEGWLENLKLVLASGTEGRLEVEAPMPTGATYFHVRLVPEFSSENIVETILVIGRDMTRRRQMEEAIREAQIAAEAANQAKSRFLAHMSHEVRTPLNGLLGVNSILLESGLAKEQQQLAQVVQKSGEALLAIVNDVLDLSKIESGKLVLEDTDFDLSAVLSQVTQLHAARASRKGVTICTELDPAIPRWVRSDAMRLQQVLNNLVSNAIKFSDSGSVRLCVALREVDAGQMNVAFSVADQGIGIAPEACAHIFEPFRQGDASTTRRFGGTGLGLTICREIVELMGGHLAVESEVGKGSTFSFALKFRPGQAVSGENSNGDELVLPHLPLSVLVAEDGELNRFVVLHQLEQFGCRVQAVPDGKAAVAKAMTEQFDLILMDCQMPVMDGYEATGAIRRWEETSGGRVRIVALTAHALPEERERCLVTGMDDNLTKPVRVQQLQAILESVAANQVAKSEAPPKEASEG